MTERIRVVLFSEVNSKLGSPFLDLLARHPQVELAGVVTSRPGRLCSYFVDDPDQVDLAAQAAALGVPVLRPAKVNSPDSLAGLGALDADYFIVGNYQQILKEELLALPRVTSVNFHPSPLPRYAGLAPFYWMVRHGERLGAVSAIEITPGVDAGPLLMQKPMLLTGQETALKLRTAQEQLNVRMLAELVPQLADRSFTRTPQDERARTYFGRPTDADYLIDFTQDAETVRRAVRAGYRHPGAYTLGADGERVVVLSVGVAGDTCRATLQPPGTVRRSDTGLFVATRDEWLRVITIERDGREVLVSEYEPSMAHGTVLGVADRVLVPA
ncbi:methionyl-tRNA formyltransferase [Streptomyces sp. NPDC047928]|uniref:methionyl-tRNA formyltransferase n=1 Tax=unclassified Streptomyces TaxID=2593676 RepID=UPI0037153440